jgi:hypothetical protein
MSIECYTEIIKVESELATVAALHNTSMIGYFHAVTNFMTITRAKAIGIVVTNCSIIYSPPQNALSSTSLY